MAQSAIDASPFLPFTIFRLQPYAVQQQVKLTVSLYEPNKETPRKHNLSLSWNSSSDTLTTPPIQQHTITEWAACGIALAIVPLYTNYQVLEVAQMGERFDYWLGRSSREVGLEISGTIEGDIALRTKVKKNQLKRNPYQSEGYVCVVGFEAQQVWLSFATNEV